MNFFLAVHILFCNVPNIQVMYPISLKLCLLWWKGTFSIYCILNLWFQILINSIPRSLKDNKLQDRTLGKVEEETAGWVLLFPLTCLCGCEKYWQLMFMFLVFKICFLILYFFLLWIMQTINILFSGSPHSSKQIWQLRQ